MFGMPKTIAGDYTSVIPDYKFGGGSIDGITCYKKGEKYYKVKSDIVSCTLVNENNKSSFIGKAGWGAAGAVALGPIGLLAGVLAGGNKKEMTIAIEFKDGTKTMLTGKTSAMEPILKFGW